MAYYKCNLIGLNYVIATTKPNNMKTSKLLTNMAELSAILFYADFLSLQHVGVPVTDTCKYFYIHGVPLNICYICDTEPFYNPENPYFLQSKQEYELIKARFGEDGVTSFVDTICNLKACGMVSAETMLRVIHRFSSPKRHRRALEVYNEWKKNLTYNHFIKNDDGDTIIAKCSKEIAHIDKARGLPVESSLLPSSRLDRAVVDKNTKLHK